MVPQNKSHQPGVGLMGCAPHSTLNSRTRDNAIADIASLIVRMMFMMREKWLSGRIT